MKNIFIIVLFVLTNSFLKSQELPKELNSYINSVLKEFSVPGLAVSVVVDGKVVLSEGFGTKHLGKDEPVSNKTLFGIASNTKAFTAVALAILVEEGKLEWDKPVINYMRWFQLSNPYITAETTVRDLLVHRIGLDLGAGDLLWWPESEFSRKEIVERLKYLPITSGFRSQYAYDNVLYIAAGQLIEEVTGKSWEDFVEERILNPLGMDESILRYRELIKDNDVSGTHAVIQGSIKKVAMFLKDNSNPAAGLNSCADDMGKWMIALLDSGKIKDDKRLFSKRTLEQLWSLVTPIQVRNPAKELAAQRSNFRGYALGFGVRDYRGYKMINHTGALPGYYSQLTLIPDKKIGIAVLTNSETGEAFSSITYYILDYLLNSIDTDWLSAYSTVKKRNEQTTSDYLEKIEAERNKDSKPSLPLKSFSGKYKDKWYGDIDIQMVNEKLVIKFAKTGVLIGDLVHWQYNTFVVRWRDAELRADAFITFYLTPDGKIEFAKMTAVSPDTDFSFDFHHLTLIPE